MKARARQRGFALIAAIFLLVVLAGAGAFALRLNQSQLHGADLDLLGARAHAAALAGVEYAAARIASTGGCNGFPATFAVAHGFTVTVSCSLPPSTPTVFSVDVSASHGVYGAPDFAARRMAVRVTTS